MNNKIRIAAIGDLHMQRNIVGTFRTTFGEISTTADILVLCGDLTNTGQIEEAKILAEELEFCKIPIVGVLGNHDYADDKPEEIKKILSSAMFILGDQPYIFKEVGFAGVKGFCGGFDNHVAMPFGEHILKQFVYESISEALKLEAVLAELETEKKVVVLHYSPIRQTIEGEPLEIYPLLGTSRLAEPIDAFGVNVVFHGHAHHGSPKGKTEKGIPVYNVSLPVLSRYKPPQSYILIEV